MGSKYEKLSNEIKDDILQGLMEGRSLSSICKEPGMPTDRCVRYWIVKDPEFAQQYAIAKEEGIDALVEEMLDIADDASNDWMESNDPDNPGWKFNKDHVNRSRLRVDTRKWYACKLKAKKYGERVALDHTGKIGLEQLVLGSFEKKNDDNGE